MKDINGKQLVKPMASITSLMCPFIFVLFRIENHRENQ